MIQQAKTGDKFVRNIKAVYSLLLLCCLLGGSYKALVQLAQMEREHLSGQLRTSFVLLSPLLFYSC